MRAQGPKACALCTARHHCVLSGAPMPEPKHKIFLMNNMHPCYTMICTEISRPRRNSKRTESQKPGAGTAMTKHGRLAGGHGAKDFSVLRFCGRPLRTLFVLHLLPLNWREGLVRPKQGSMTPSHCLPALQVVGLQLKHFLLDTKKCSAGHSQCRSHNKDTHQPLNASR